MGIKSGKVRTIVIWTSSIFIKSVIPRKLNLTITPQGVALCTNVLVDAKLSSINDWCMKMVLERWFSTKSTYCFHRRPSLVPTSHMVYNHIYNSNSKNPKPSYDFCGLLNIRGTHMPHRRINTNEITLIVTKLKKPMSFL